MLYISNYLGDSDIKSYAHNAIPICVIDMLVLHADTPIIPAEVNLPLYAYQCISINSTKAQVQSDKIKLMVNTILDNVLVHRNLNLAIEWRQLFLQKSLNHLVPPIITLDGWFIEKSGIVNQLLPTRFLIGAPDIAQTPKWRSSLALCEIMVQAMATYTLLHYQQFHSQGKKDNKTTTI